MSEAVPVGIDLGTTYSCIAVWHNNDVRVIPNMQGNKTTPSVVGFTDDQGIVVGEAAVRQMLDNPDNTVFDAKRLIGKQYDDSQLQEDMKRWPFKVIRHADGRPKLQVSYQGKMQTFFPEQISAFVLGKLKENAEEFLGKKVKDAVITIPAYFNNGQRQATIDAAKIAGLNVLQIINEPTAAAIAYATEKKMTGERTVLVYDLGGGTFDVSLINVISNNYTVLATTGDNHLGGNEFDNNMVDYFVGDIKTKQKVDISTIKRSMNKLRERCETAKRDISSSGQHTSTVVVDSLYDGNSFKGIITRSRFNEMNKDLFDSTKGPLQQVLDDAKMQPHKVDDVVLAGGSTRIPAIRDLIQNFFGDKPIASINPDEIVAKGAALRAVTFSDKVESLPTLKNFRLTDVNALSLGVGCLNDVMSVLIPRNTTLPATKKGVYKNIEHNQKRMHFPVYEGESPNAKENHQVDQFSLDVEPQPLNETKVDVSFTLNTDGILHVKATDRKSEQDKSITTKLARLDHRELTSLLREAERFKEEDRLFRENAEAKHDLGHYAYAASYKSETSKKLDPNEKGTIFNKCNDANGWIAKNKLAPPKQFEQKLQELKRICEPLLKNA